MKRSLVPVKDVADSRKQSFGKEDLEKLLKQHFGYSKFRGKQLDAIEAVLSGRDCFCLMPTGGGKSMCYQIPALTKPGIVLVISPLIALMENQVTMLKMKGIHAEFLSSTQITHAKEKIHEDLNSGNPSLRLLYVTPELVATFGFMTKLTVLYERRLLSLIAIDEAHCISSWGHDFRPSYRKLSSLRSRLPDVPILALTATAVPKVQKDVIESLCLHHPLILRASFNRPNIFYEVRYKDLLDNAYADLSNLIKSSGNVCSIVYCLERSTCDDLSNHLSKDGISSAAYHAGLNNKLRSSVLDDWLSYKIQVVVATVAFGMGIDRKDVRIVCHFNTPKTMEGFYQESGRAGRDQLPSRSVLYYGLDDRRKMEFILRSAASKRKQSSCSSEDFSKKSLADFNQMVEYCEGSVCRRKKILESFGELVSASFCQKSCDSCKNPNIVSKCLEKLSGVSSIHKKGGLAPVYIGSSVDATFDGRDSEFWNQDDEASFSDDDISNSEDEAEIICNSVRSEISSKAGIHEKFEVLKHAEDLYYQRENQKRQVNGLDAKKVVTDSLRDAGRKRLLNSFKQAEQRLGDLSLDSEASATFLEMECFKKYGKVGKTFYNSQLAATVRWFSSSSYEQIQERLSANDSTLAAQSQDEIQAELINEETNENIQSECCYEFADKEKSPEEKIELPSIPSFAEFVNKKVKEVPRISSEAVGVKKKRAVESKKDILNYDEKRVRRQ